MSAMLTGLGGKKFKRSWRDPATNDAVGDGGGCGASEIYTGVSVAQSTDAADFSAEKRDFRFLQGH